MAVSQELAVALAAALPEAGGQKRAARIAAEGVDVLADRELHRRALQLLPADDESNSLRMLAAARLARADKITGDAELSKLYCEFGLPSVAEFATTAAAAAANEDDARAAFHYFMARRDDSALQYGLAFLRRESVRTCRGAPRGAPSRQPWQLPLCTN